MNETTMENQILRVKFDNYISRTLNNYSENKKIVNSNAKKSRKLTTGILRANVNSTNYKTGYNAEVAAGKSSFSSGAFIGDGKLYNFYNMSVGSIYVGRRYFKDTGSIACTSGCTVIFDCDYGLCGDEGYFVIKATSGTVQISIPASYKSNGPSMIKLQ